MGTVLVVDDTAEIRMLLVATLQQAGHEVVEALDGSDVMRWAREIQPDAIILDLMMPEVDGWEAPRQLKAEESTSHIPVIISSALDSDADLARARSLGAHDYIAKPWSAGTLLERLRWAISSAAA